MKTLRSINAEEAEAAILAAANKRKIAANKSPDHSSKLETGIGTTRPQGYTRNEMCEVDNTYQLLISSSSLLLSSRL